MSFNIIYAGMVESTNMSMTEKLVTIIRAFSYEMSAVAKSYNGYVLKYVGDAIILFFPSSFNKYRCASSMINVVKNGINPVLNNDFSQENVVVQYGYEKRSPIDLLVCCTNVAAKITFLTAPNKISIGENIYELLHPKIQLEFQGLTNLNEKETEIH